MTQQPPPAPPQAPRDALDRFFDRARATGIRRRLSDRWLAGVCGGIADKIGVDPLVVRILWFFLASTGLGLAAYFLAFALMPDSAEEIPLEKAVRQGDGQSIILLVFTGLLLINVVQGGPTLHVGDGRVHVSGIVPVLAAAGIAWVWWRRRRRGATTGSVTSTGPDAARAATSTPDLPAAAQPARPMTTLPGQEAGSTGTLPLPDRTSAAAPGVASPALAWPAGASTADRGQASTPVTTGPAYVPVRRRRPSLGWPGAVAAVGLAVAGSGSVLAAQHSGRLHLDNPYLVAAAAALALCATFLLVVGLAGRRGGAATVITLVLTAAALTGGPVVMGQRGPSVLPVTMDDGHSVGMGRATWTPTVLRGRETYEVGMGRGVLDLTRLSRPALQGRTVATDVGMGTLTVRLPQGVTTRVNSDVGAGRVTLQHLDGSTERIDGEHVIGQGQPVLTIDAQVGMGTMIIQEVAQ